MKFCSLCVCFTVEDLTNSRTDDSEFGSCAWGVKVQETEEMKWKRKYGKDRRELVKGGSLAVSKPQGFTRKGDGNYCTVY